MSFDFFVDLTSWALPLRVDVSRCVSHIDILCFHIHVWMLPPKTFPEETPEEELRRLDEHEKETLAFISEERARIHKRMGGSKRND